ncbi:MAG: class F sortase [Patescibacteria group bacterium]
MRSKISFKKLFFIVNIFAIIFSAIVIVSLSCALPVSNSHANGYVSQNLVNGASAESTQIMGQTVLTIRLKIPKIKVDTALESVGLTAQGAVNVPKGLTNAAWFNLGPHPGENGNAVITGHYGIWKNGTPTVFNNLYKLRPGDKLYIENEKGEIITFVVRESRNYNPNTDASDIFISNDGKSHLNLITCEGAWNKVSKSYPKRLVVFTDKE